MGKEGVGKIERGKWRNKVIKMKRKSKWKKKKAREKARGTGRR